MMTDLLLTGLPAQVDARTRVLVLGSMPGVVSLQQQCYYAHPRNRFWPLMESLFAVPAALAYARRLGALNAAGVGLWDVIGQCRRRGSLDSAIERGSERPNDIAGLVATLPQLAVVACNGGAAHQAFMRHIAPQLGPKAPPVLALPSTSPANAGWPLPRLLEAWQPLRGYLR